MEMNYDYNSSSFDGDLKALGYAGELSSLAFRLMNIDRELEGEEWCDLFIDENEKIFAVFGDGPITSEGEFYFLEVTPDHPEYNNLADKK